MGRSTTYYKQRLCRVRWSGHTFSRGAYNVGIASPSTRCTSALLTMDHPMGQASIDAPHSLCSPHHSFSEKLKRVPVANARDCPILRLLGRIASDMYRTFGAPFAIPRDGLFLGGFDPQQPKCFALSLDRLLEQVPEINGRDCPRRAIPPYGGEASIYSRQRNALSRLFIGPACSSGLQK